MDFTRTNISIPEERNLLLGLLHPGSPSFQQFFYDYDNEAESAFSPIGTR
ncbi:hypothetical protein ABH917_000838 [Thermobifida halotolerans]